MQSAIGLYILLRSALQVFLGKCRLLTVQTPCRGGRQLQSRCCAKANYQDVVFSRRVFPKHVSKEICKLKKLPYAQVLLYFKTTSAALDT